MTTPQLLESLLTKYFRWLLLGLAVLIIALGYVFFLSARVSSIQTVAFGERDRARQDLARQEQFEKNLRTSVEKYKQIFTAEQRARLDSVLPMTADFPTLLLTINTIAAASGYDLSSLSVSPVGQVKAATEPVGTAAPKDASSILTDVSSIPNLVAQDMAIQVNGSASYDQFKAFVARLEKNQRLFDVLSLSYSGAAGSSSIANQFGFTIRTYSYSGTETTP